MNGWMRRVGAWFAVGAALVAMMAGPGSALADDVSEKAYATREECEQVSGRDCRQWEDGKWHAFGVGRGIGSDGPGYQFDTELLERQGRAMWMQTSGTPDHPVVAVDYEQVEFPDVQPFLDRSVGRVRVPVRFVSEKMGATVTWEGSTQTVTILREGLTITLQVQNEKASVNDRTLALDAPPILVEGRVMVPLRFIAEAFGATVDWVGDRPPGEYYPGQYQVWIWVPWGYWGKKGLSERLGTYVWLRD